MESTLQKPALIAAKTTAKAKTIVYWIVIALFCLQMSFTAYAQLRLPQVAEAFTHLGFPAYFRVELSWAKLLGVVLMLAPVPARLKEWAYAGFAINLLGAHRPPLGGRLFIQRPKRYVPKLQRPRPQSRRGYRYVPR